MQVLYYLQKITPVIQAITGRRSAFYQTGATVQQVQVLLVYRPAFVYRDGRCFQEFFQLVEFPVEGAVKNKTGNTGCIYFGQVDTRTGKIIIVQLGGCHQHLALFQVLHIWLC